MPKDSTIIYVSTGESDHDYSHHRTLKKAIKARETSYGAIYQMTFAQFKALTETDDSVIHIEDHFKPVWERWK